MAFTDYFSIIAFFIFLRESLEAAVIIAVLLQCMNRVCPSLKKQVWWGAGLGIGISLIFGAIFAIIYYVANDVVFTGNGKAIFSGVMFYLACILITYLAFAMMRFASMENKWHRKLDAAAREAAEKSAAPSAATSKRNRYSIFLLAFTTVVREGIEAVVFLFGVGTNTTFKAIPLACVAGLAVGIAVGFFVFYTGKTIKDLKVLFVLVGCLLFVIAAGQVANGTQSLATVGTFGKWSVWNDEQPQQLQQVWNVCGCCSDEATADNKFWPLLRALFGWQCAPVAITLMFYCIYWGVVLFFVAFKLMTGTLFDGDLKYKRQQQQKLKQAKALAAAGGGDNHLEEGTQGEFDAARYLGKDVDAGVPNNVDSACSPSKVAAQNKDVDVGFRKSLDDSACSAGSDLARSETGEGGCHRAQHPHGDKLEIVVDVPAATSPQDSSSGLGK